MLNWRAVDGLGIEEPGGDLRHLPAVNLLGRPVGLREGPNAPHLLEKKPMTVVSTTTEGPPSSSQNRMRRFSSSTAARAVARHEKMQEAVFDIWRSPGRWD